MRYGFKRFTSMFLAVLMVVSCINLPAVFGGEPGAADSGTVVKEQDFRLEAFNTPGHSSGNIKVHWESQGEDWAYRYYQRAADSEEQWEERSTKYGKPIDVLNITSNTSKYLEYWLKTFPGVSESNNAKVNVTSVYQTTFENNPDSYLLDENGKYKYDVVVVGFADLYGDSGNAANKHKAVAALEKFINAGRGVLFGHDTFYDAIRLNDQVNAIPTGFDDGSRWAYKTQPTNQSQDWFNDHGGNPDVWIRGTWGYGRLAKYAGVIPGVSADGQYWTSRFGSRGTEGRTDWTTANFQYSNGTDANVHNHTGQQVSYVKVTDGGFLTSYPNELPLGTVLTVPRSHVNGSAASGKEWMTYVQDASGKAFPFSTNKGLYANHHAYEFNGLTYKDSGYLVSHKNTALIQTGHWTGIATKDEIAILVNTMYHLAQLTMETELEDASALDSAAPDHPTAVLAGMVGQQLKIDIHADDNGTAYEMYVEAIEQTGSNAAKDSDIVRQTSATGTKGYLYLISDKDAGEITMADLAAKDAQSGQYLPAPAQGALDLVHINNEGGSLNIDAGADAGRYLHAAAYDFAGNLSGIATYAVDDFKPAIHIKIVDKDSNPVPSAVVTALGETGLDVDASGSLTVYPGGPGAYTVAAFAEGYQMGSETVVITSEQLVAEAVVRLEDLSSGSLYGFVRDIDTRKPVSGATVRTLTGKTAQTDDYGFYLIADLTVGTYTVIASLDGYNSGFSTVAVPLGHVQKDFFLQAQDGVNNQYILSGVVSDSSSAEGIEAGAVVHGATGATALTDQFGGYALGFFKEGSEGFDYAKTGYMPKLNEQIHFSGKDMAHDVALDYLDGQGKVLVRVTNTENQVLKDAKVVFAGTELTTDAKGEALFTSNYGSYGLLVQRTGFNAYTSLVEVNQDYRVVEVALTQGNQGALYGKVIDSETDLGIPGAKVETVDPDGKSAFSDSGGYYVLSPLSQGKYAVVASKDQYAPAAEILTVRASGISAYDFYLDPSEQNRYFIYGQVLLEGSNQGVMGAAVTEAAENGKITHSDFNGYYALLDYAGGSSVGIYAEKDNQKSGMVQVAIENEPVWQDLTIRSAFTVIVQYKELGTEEILFSYTIPSSKSAAAFKIQANAYTGYRLVSDPDWVEINPVEAAPDGEDCVYVVFYYQNNTADVTIKAYTLDEAPIPAFAPFTETAEIGSLFTYDKVIPIPGYTFARGGAAITVAEGGDNTYPLYYYRDTGNMTVRAVTADGNPIGNVDKILQINDEYLVNQENAPTAAQIPALAYYTLRLEKSYVGEPGVASYRYTGASSVIPEAVYVYDRNDAAVRIELRLTDDTVVAWEETTAPRGQAFTYTYIQAQRLLADQATSPQAYTFVTKQDQKPFIGADTETETIVFYLTQEKQNVTLDIHYRYFDEEGAEHTITTSSITGAAGEEKTIKAADILGWVLAGGEDAQKTVTLAQGMAPVVFYYERDYVTVTVTAADQNGTEIPLSQESSRIKAARHTPYVLHAPAVQGYRAVDYKLAGMEYAGAVASFTAQDMAGDLTVAFVYEQETIDDYAVSVQVNGVYNGEPLYSYKAVFPKNSGRHSIAAFSLQGYRIVGDDTKEIVAGETAEPGVVDFVYASLDTAVAIQLINDDTQEVRTLTAAAVLGEPFSFNAPYVSGWYLVDTETIQMIEAVQDGDLLEFHYKSIAGNKVIVNAVEVDGQGNVLRSIKTAVQDTAQWVNGSTAEINVKELMALEGAPDYYSYRPSAADPEGSGKIRLIYDELNGHTFEVFYIKDMAQVTINAVDMDDNLINSYETRQRKGEVFLAEAPQVDFTAYAPVGEQARNAVAFEDAPVSFVYKKIGRGALLVTAADIDNAENILQSYVVSGNLDQVLAVQAPDLSGLGWDLAQGQQPVQSVKVGEENDPVQFLYQDMRHRVKLYTSFDDTNEIRQYDLVPYAGGAQAVFYAPYVDGYLLRAYQLDGGEMREVTASFSGLPLTVSKDTEIVFHYQPISEIIDAYTVGISVTGKDANSGRVLYSYDIKAPINSGEREVAAFAMEGYRLAGENPAVVTVEEQDIQMVFNYETLLTSVTIKMVDGNEADIAPAYQVNAQTGMAMTFYAPHVPGYALLGAAEQSITPQSDGGGNLVSFIYVPINSHVTLLAKERAEGGDRLIQAVEIDETLLEAGGDATVPVPEIAGYGKETETVTINWDGVSSIFVDAYYTKNKTAVTVAYVDAYSGAAVSEPENHQVRAGEAATFEAPAIAGYHLVSDWTATIVAAAGGENRVVFRYRNIASDEIIVKLVNMDTNALMDSYAVKGAVNEEITLKAPVKQGWLLVSPPEATGTVGETKEIVFQYKADTVTVTMLLQTEDEKSLGEEKAVLLRGESYTARAPHVPGYVIAGSSQEKLEHVNQNTAITFQYRHISVEVPRYTVDIHVRGMDRDTNRDIYSYSLQRPTNSGPVSIEAMDVSGYELLGEGTKSVDVGEQAITVTFTYASVHRVITIYAETADGQPVENFTPILAEAAKGQAFSYNAPHITGYTYVGYRLENGFSESVTQTIPEVQDDEGLYFQYERAAGNVLITLREDGPDGRIIKTMSDELLAGESKRIPIPDLRASYYTALSTEEAQVTNEGNSLIQVAYYYKKDVRNVEIRAVDAGGNGVLAKQQAGSFRVGEAQVFRAFYDERLDGYRLAGGNEIRTVVEAGAGDYVIEFQYYALGLEEVLVLAVDKDTADVLGSSVIAAGQGAVIKVNALAVAGYYLAEGEPSYLNVTAPGTAVFQYAKDTVAVTLSLVDNNGHRIHVSDDIQTRLVYGRGQNVTVFAPHIAGYVIEDAGKSKVSFLPVAKDENVEFAYTPIEEIIDIYKITIHVAGQDTLSSLLYADQKEVARNSGEVIISSRQVWGYALADILVDGVSQGADAVEAGEARLEVAAQDMEVVFCYRNLDTQVNIILQDYDSGDTIEAFSEPAQEGKPFTYRAPHLNGYYLMNTSVIGAVEQVAGDGSSEIIFYYRKWNSNVLIFAREENSGGIIKIVQVQTAGFEEGLNYVDAPDLSGDYYSYAGNEFDPEDTTGIIAFFYNPMSNLQMIDVYYKKDTAEIRILAKETNAAGKILATDHETVPKGETVTINAPQIKGYDLTSKYKLTVTPVTDMEIEFYYKEMSTGGNGGNGGGNGGNGGGNSGNGGGNKGGNDGSAASTQKKKTTLTVIGMDEEGGELYQEVTTETVGALISIKARDVDGYAPYGEITKSITISSDQTKNVVIFRYAKENQGVQPESHKAYVTGYEDGAFRPANKLTRAEAAMILFNLTDDPDKYGRRENPYQDVEPGYWYTQAILYLSGQGVMKGYGDGIFQPNAYITRAEMATVCSLYFNPGAKGSHGFTDVPDSHWASDYIGNAHSKGWIVGYGDGTFRPNMEILRAEAVVMINGMFNRRIYKEDIPVSVHGYQDVPASYWGYEAIMEASTDHDYKRVNERYETWTSVR